jgi:hypothetical protein
MNTQILKRSSTGLILAVFAMFSCKEEDRLTVADTQEITEESVTDSYFLDLDDMATVAIAAPADNEYSGGRAATIITITDLRFSGATVTIVPGASSTLSEPNGVMTVDFGTASTDQRGNIRSGKLIFTYSKWRFKPGSKIITTTDNYVINGVKLEGTRTLTNINSDSDLDSSPRKFNALLENGKATFLLDGTTAERESDITWEWNWQNAGEDFLTILNTSSASGKTCDGKLYEVSVYESLIYKRNCGIAVSGIKKYLLESKEITIDYGDGNCDKSVVVTVNGTSRGFTISQ